MVVDFRSSIWKWWWQRKVVERHWFGKIWTFRTCQRWNVLWSHFSVKKFSQNEEDVFLRGNTGFGLTDALPLPEILTLPIISWSTTAILGEWSSRLPPPRCDSSRIWLFHNKKVTMRVNLVKNTRSDGVALFSLMISASWKAQREASKRALHIDSCCCWWASNGRPWAPSSCPWANSGSPWAANGRPWASSGRLWVAPWESWSRGRRPPPREAAARGTASPFPPAHEEDEDEETDKDLDENKDENDAKKENVGEGGWPGRLFAVQAFSRAARQTCLACQGSRPLCSPKGEPM